MVCAWTVATYFVGSSILIDWARSSSAKRSAKKTYLAELLSTDLSRRWDKTFVLAGSLYPQVTELWAVQAEDRRVACTTIIGSGCGY